MVCAVDQVHLGNYETLSLVGPTTPHGTATSKTKNLFGLQIWTPAELEGVSTADKSIPVRGQR